MQVYAEIKRAGLKDIYLWDIEDNEHLHLSQDDIGLKVQCHLVIHVSVGLKQFHLIKSCQKSDPLISSHFCHSIFNCVHFTCAFSIVLPASYPSSSFNSKMCPFHACLLNHFTFLSYPVTSTSMPSL